MALNNVKELTVPVNGTDKAVKMIQDSNGNIIWGSQSAFPYRRLEYIHFSGAESINTNYVPTINTAIKFNLKVTGAAPSPSDGNNVLIGGWDGHLADNTSKRLFWVWSPGAGKYRAVIGNTWNDTNLDLVTYPAWFGIGCLNYSTFKNVAFGVRSSNWDASSAVLYYQAQQNSTSFSGWQTKLTIGGENTQNNTLDSTRYSCIDVYEGYQHAVGSPWGTTPDANSPVKHWIPCQRKSDNVCGLYDVLNSVFYPMQGTTITTGAAGPIVNEYWDLTA